MMKRTDIVFYSMKNRKAVRDFIECTFPTHNYLIYEVDMNQLISKSWFNLFSFLIIDLNDQEVSNDDKVTSIIRNAVYNNRRVILFSGDIEFDYLKSDSILFETLNKNIIIGKVDDYISLIIINTFNLSANDLKIIWDICNLSANLDYQVHTHSDIYVSTKYKDKCLAFLKFLKTCNLMKEKSFKYSNFQFTLNLPESESEILKSHKLLSYIDLNNIQREERFSFNIEDYFSALHSKTLGHIVLYAEVLGSSFDLMDRFISFANYNMGMIVISKVQTEGKGRGNNKWISPIGCAMFTCSLLINMNSYLGNSMCLIQHILAVSIVESLFHEFQIDKNLLKIKWPNDIYCANRGKLSGIISKASVIANEFHCLLGCGINVSNNDPTICIYDLIRQSNIYNAKYPSIETVIACVMNYFETNISSIQSCPEGIKKFKNKYYEYWMHQDQRVTIKDDKNNISGRISGINDFGYLEMVPDKSNVNESVIMLHPDGNSFDMMHNLIIPKK